jgi:O-antigen ligase
MPDLLAEQLLARLAVIGYPDAGIIQYIEQNPELPERAISTSVNPNSLGGLLLMVAALAAPQLITEHPLTGRRWHALPILAALAGCLVLTFSRGSMGAFALALLFLAALRYRRILLVIALLALVLLALPWSQPYLARFVEGLQGADLATQMRIGEYGDAFTLISRYPLFGVGFSGAPDIDIYLGVSSVYLTIAENMGLLGLCAFVVLMIAVFAYAWRARPHLDAVPGLRPIWLGLLAGLIGALAGGVLDHYFFNLEFQHAVAIFWTFVGLTLAATRIALEASKAEPRAAS